eukprot:TRINITY_DN17094_c0_g1_i1.p1 TRINITY_DN17094_c0_g1~~TRINITY_DN17094_c0_g1_i1.p1  ORF type:complete len:267 (+),score=62.57 TRINITY_DN17094_c0_g1_i1:410-1210(+)
MKDTKKENMTEFRPCIDLHEGKVKQIVGSSLKETGEGVEENFVSSNGAGYYAEMYKRDGLRGGHVIMLGKGCEEEAKEALRRYPGGLQVGGGVNESNAAGWIEAGASHVIVTSYMFEGDELSITKIQKLVDVIGKDRLVLDLSCKQTPSGWSVAKDKWQTVTSLPVTHATLDLLSQYCSEFLVHAADVEGKCQGIDTALVEHLAEWGKIPITYAGGAKSVTDLETISKIAKGKPIHLTYGSSLDIFGGNLVKYSDCVEWHNANKAK